MKIVFHLLLLLFATCSFGQDDLDMTSEKSFLIISSTKKYNQALRQAQKAANKLVIPMDFRGMTNDQNQGLTSNETCGCGEKHGYLPRGRYDDGKYISIEYSSAYDGFSPNYYIVIIASGPKDELKSLLPETQKQFKDAYIKSTKIYMGCMH